MMFGPALAWVKLYSHLIAAVAIAAAIVIGVWWVDNNGYNRAVAVMQAKAEAERNSREAAKLAKEKQVELDSLKAKEKRDAKDLQFAKDLATANSRTAAALAELRKRPSRSGGSINVPASAASAATAPSCTGAGLFRDDSEFLTRRIAAGADTLRLALKKCYQDYDDAVELVNKHNSATVKPGK